MRIAMYLFVLMLAGEIAAGPIKTSVEEASLVVDPGFVICPLRQTLFGTNVTTGDKGLMANPEFVARVRQQSYTSFRFPNGCEADLYNWKSPAKAQATVDEFLDFCQATGAEPYYTLNLQGGTEGIEGAVGKDASLEEKIRHKHTAPNPCGYTNYHFGTLAEALELFRKYTLQRALDGKLPITAYEMGNENWGQAFTDWTFDVYGKTVEVFAGALRAELSRAQAEHPELRKIRLHITAVGFPVMGNNMKLVDTPDRTTNIAWTSEINRLYDAGIIDAVQEHYYPYAYANGGALLWTAHNLHNILLARAGRANTRLKAYQDPKLVYKAPLEFTEWNVKCWGPGYDERVQPANAGFEDGVNGWMVEGSMTRSAEAARRGSNGLVLLADKANGRASVRQVLDIGQSAATVIAGVWIRTDTPGAVRLTLREAAGPDKGRMIAQYKPVNPAMWERVICGGRPGKANGKVEIAIEAARGARVWVDEAHLYTSTVVGGQPAVSASRYEQVLFTVDALREMAAGGAIRAHLHHLAGDYPCGAMSSKGEIKDLGQAFAFVNRAHGDKVLKAEVKSPVFRYAASTNPWATDFNALTPNLRNAPMLGTLVSRDKDRLYIWLVNRSSDRTIRVNADAGMDLRTDGRVRVMTGEDIDLKLEGITEKPIKTGRKFQVDVAPYSAVIVMAGVR